LKSAVLPAIERDLERAVTSRNWSTMLKLADLLD